MKPKSNGGLCIYRKAVKRITTSKKINTNTACRKSRCQAYIHFSYWRNEAMVSLPTLVKLVNALDTTLL